MDGQRACDLQQPYSVDSVRVSECLSGPRRNPFRACPSICFAPFPLAKVQPAFETFDFGTKQGTCRRHLRRGSCAPMG